MSESTSCSHCWHAPTVTYTLACYPPRTMKVCCHCGTQIWEEQQIPDTPEGHGAFYPKQFGYTIRNTVTTP